MLRSIAALLVNAGLIFCQSANKPLAFDAASVKPAKPLPPGPIIMSKTGPDPLRPSGGPGTDDPGRIHYPGVTLNFLVSEAYHIEDNRIQGPAWLRTERFAIDATMPPKTTREQFRVMLQNLLAERFKLALHRETKALPGYALVVAKSGLRLKESIPGPNDTDEPPSRPTGPPKPGPDGFPLLPGLAGRVGIFSIEVAGRFRLIGHHQTMLDLIDHLNTHSETSQFRARPVKDETGLTAKYDFILTFAPDYSGTELPMASRPPSDQPELEPLPDIFTAIQAQLGLKLEPRASPSEVVVIDHVERTPTGN